MKIATLEKSYFYSKSYKFSTIHTTETHIVPKIIAAARLQEYGVGIFDIITTKSALKKELKKKHITVNGVVATSATYIQGGETIQLSIPKIVTTKKKFVFPLHLLFEDEYLAVIHKPAGILVSGNHFRTITNALIQHIKPSKLPDTISPQPVHRLDYATTGILVIGKTRDSIHRLNKIFEDKIITKTYYAITIGSMNEKGYITSKIEGKNAGTRYEVISTVPSKRFERLNLVKLLPESGRRHQLRIHLSSMGNPILGDSDYGIPNLILKGKGMYLHAYSLEFKHPFTKENVYFKDQLPQSFKKIFTGFEAL